MKRFAFLLAAVIPIAASAGPTLESSWTAAGAPFDGLGLHIKVLRPITVKGHPELGGEISLGDLAEIISRDPGAVEAIIDALVKSAGRLGSAWDSPERRKKLEEALRGADKQFLDTFPILTPPQLLAAAKLYVSRMNIPVPAPVPVRQTLALAGKPRRPKHDEFLKDLGHGLMYGDHADLNQVSAFGDNKEIAEVLNRLAGNVPGAPTYTLDWNGVGYTTVADFLTAIEVDSTIEVRDMRYYANFGDLFLDAGGKRNEVRTPLYTDTGYTLPSGRRLIVPVAHSGLDILIRGKVNADLSFFFGIDGAADFRADSSTNQRWVGGRNLGSSTGAAAKALIVRSAWVRRELISLAKKFKLKAGGYGPLGECNGVHAFITGVAPYPMTRDPRYFNSGSPLDALSKSLPNDITGKPDLSRVLDSRPFEKISDITLPEVREALKELRGLLTAPSGSGK